ncbi:MAG TPA: TetR/AcrR family transcriptional regulator [Mesotoga infera]|nr:TetR/AcrR family transcriptional regulator [Mesotoga infera]
MKEVFVIPKETFFNLPLEKRERIIEAAIDEFSRNDYREARINEIVRLSSIPKGSFYQYFEDKKDLFRYVIDLLYEKKMKVISAVMNSAMNASVFQTLRLMAEAAIEMAEENPRLSRIGDRLMADPALMREVFEDYRPSSDGLMESLVKQGIERGDIAPWVDPSLAARLITAFLLALGDAVRETASSNLTEEARKKFYSMVDILENGMRRREQDDRS